MRQPTKGTDGIYDFDALVHEPRVALVGGEKVDVSIIPVAVTLAMAEFADRTRDEVLAAAEEDPGGELRRVLNLVSNVCMPSNPKFTVDFLMNNMDMEKIRLFNEFVLKPLRESDEGNVEATE